MKCKIIKEPLEQLPVDQLVIKLKQEIDVQKLVFQNEKASLKEAFERERQEMKRAFEETMKEQINKILEKHAGSTNNTTNNQIDNSTNNNNITININAFGDENTDYIDDKAFLA
jgi:ABC-type transporter MlaC component